MFVVTTIKQVMRWGIEPFGFPEPAHISERMLVTACANLVFARCIMGGPRRRCTTLGSGRIFFRADLQEADDEYFANLRNHFRTVKRQLWPPARGRSPLLVHGFKLIRTFESRDLYAACDARVIYRDGKLVEIELATHNGQGPDLKVGFEPFTQQ